MNKRHRAGLQRLTLEEEVYTKERPPPIEGQLQAVLAHIEDLHVRALSENGHVISFFIHSSSCLSTGGDRSGVVGRQLERLRPPSHLRIF